MTFLNKNYVVIILHARHLHISNEREDEEKLNKKYELSVNFRNEINYSSIKFVFENGRQD